MSDASHKSDHTLVLFLLAVFVFISPFTEWWSTLQLPWYSMFLIWALIIVLIAINQLRSAGRRGD